MENKDSNSETKKEEETSTETGLKMTLADIQAIEAGQPPSPPADSFVPDKLGICKKCGWKFVNEQVKEKCTYCGGKVEIKK